MTAYNDGNLFARILRGEIPCSKVHETEHALAFKDINPQAPVHVLVIPKGPYVSWDDFAAGAPPTAQAGYVAAIGETAKILGVDATGYRLITNHGEDAHQEVMHLHVHILAGGRLGPMVAGGLQPQP